MCQRAAGNRQSPNQNFDLGHRITSWQMVGGPRTGAPTAVKGHSFPSVCSAIGVPISVTMLEVRKLFLRIVFRYAVALLNLACDSIAFAGDYVELVVRELAPLLFDLPLELLPVSFDPIPVHFDLLLGLAT